MGIFSFDGIELDEAPKDVVPLCPHCKAELRKLWYKAEGIAGIGQKQVVICPSCRAFLGISATRS